MHVFDVWYYAPMKISAKKGIVNPPYLALLDGMQDLGDEYLRRIKKVTVTQMAYDLCTQKLLWDRTVEKLGSEYDD